MKLTQEDLDELTLILIKNIQEEFDGKHLSGNLVNTLEVVAEKDSIKVIIPAQVYDVLLYLNQGVVVPKGTGSYASSLDEYGSSIGNRKIGNHKGYIDKIINKSIEEWTGKKNLMVAKRTG